MAKKRALSKQVVAKIKKLSSTKRVNEIAKAVGCSEYMVKVTCDKLGVPYITNTGQHKLRGKMVVKERVEKPQDMTKCMYRHITQKIKKPRGLWS